MRARQRRYCQDGSIQRVQSASGETWGILIRARMVCFLSTSKGSICMRCSTPQSKQRNDFVTNVDRACEAAIIEILQAAYPQHAILAEESGRSAQSSDHVWIID